MLNKQFNCQLYLRCHDAHVISLMLLNLICNMCWKITITELLPHIPGAKELTHRGWDKMAAIFQTTYSNAYFWMKIYAFRLKFHWSLLLPFQLTIFQHWVRYWLGADQATSHYLNQWEIIYWLIYVSLSLNGLNTSDDVQHTCDSRTSYEMLIIQTSNRTYGSGHEGGAVLLPGFAIIWWQNQVTRQLHLGDLTHMLFYNTVDKYFALSICMSLNYCTYLWLSSRW